MYNCFRCKKGGDVISFVAAHQKIEKRQAAVWLVSLMPPAEEGTLDQEAEVVTALSSMGLTDREVRLLQLMTRAHARYISAMFSCFFASAAEQLEQDAWEAVKEEIIREFPDTLFPAEEM
jgi:DNA primase